MSELRSTASAPKQGAEVLKSLQELYHLDIDETQFWQRYTALLASLCHSPLVMVLQHEQEQTWKAVESFSSLQEGEDVEVDVIEKGLSLMGTSPDKNFVFGPYSKSLPELTQPYVLISRLPSAKTGEKWLSVALLENHDSQRFQEYLVRFQLNQSIYLARQGQSSIDMTQRVLDEDVLKTLELSDVIFNQSHFQLAVMTLVNRLRETYQCTRVSLGWKKNLFMETKAISHLEKFDASSPEVQQINHVLEETVDMDRLIVVPTPRTQKDHPTLQHDQHARQRELAQVVSIPLQEHGETQAVVLLEWDEKQLFPKQIDLLHISLCHLMPWLSHLHQKDEWLHKKTWRQLQRHGLWWLGPQQTLLKVILVFITIVLVASALIKTDYKIDATATLETDHVAFLSAPFNGFVKAVHFHAGDSVSGGQAIISLDTEELQLKALEEQANINRFRRESEKARSERKLVAMKIALARVEQSQAEMQRLEYYLEHAQIKTPFGGIVIEGEREQLLGAPVTKGDLLIKVANPKDLHLKLIIDEGDIDEVKADGLGQLTLLSEPGIYHDIQVKTIIPMAEVDAGRGNVFVVKATINTSIESWWRPGMSGMVKLDVEPRSLLWVACHRTWEKIRLFLWI